MMLDTKILAWYRHKNVAELNRLMGSHPSPLYNWISITNTYINKQLTKPAQIRFHSKDHILSQK